MLSWLFGIIHTVFVCVRNFIVETVGGFIIDAALGND